MKENSTAAASVQDAITPTCHIFKTITLLSKLPAATRFPVDRRSQISQPVVSKPKFG